MRDIEYEKYEWDKIERKQNNVLCENADIYKMNIKEMNQLIYNKLEEILSLLYSNKEVSR